MMCICFLYKLRKSLCCTETGGGRSQCSRRGTQTSADPERAAGPLQGGNGERENGTCLLFKPNW